MVYIPGNDMCGFGMLDLELILRSLLSCDEGDGKTVLRVCMESNVVTSPIHCANFEDFFMNLRRSLEMAEDGQIAIRMNYDTYIDGSGLDLCPTCANGASWTDYANSIFGEDSSGNVWINIGVVCGTREVG
jgi:hypothetical protein